MSYGDSAGHLSEDPKRIRQLDMPSASAAARSIRPLETIYEDELGIVVPMTHALFLPRHECRELKVYRSETLPKKKSKPAKKDIGSMGPFCAMVHNFVLPYSNPARAAMGGA